MVSRRRFLWSAAVTAPALSLRAQTQENKPASTDLQPAPAAPPFCQEPRLPAPILALTDRTKDIVPITVDERNSRLDLSRELMKQYGLDAILMTTGASMVYYAGFNWWQSERLFAYVIPQSAAPFFICPYFERDRLAELIARPGPGDTGGLIDVIPERETTLTYLWQENEDPYIILRRALGQAGITTGMLGLEEKVPYGMANMIAMAAPAIKIASATPVTAGQRSLKSPAEIALLRLANHITIDVYKAVYLSCAPGDTNKKFSNLVEKAYARCGVQGDASCNVGPASATPHGSPKTQIIHEHEMVVIDDGCTVDGYTSDITRSFVYGLPTDFQREVFEIVHNAQSAALAAAHPGVEMQAVDAAARKVIEQAGYGPGYASFSHRLGHGIGLDMHEWPYLVGGNRQKLAPGMVFSDEPGIYLPGKFGLRLEDDMFITAQGAELFTWQSPSLQDPFAIPAKLPANPDEAAPADKTEPPATAPDAQPAAAKPAEALATPKS